MTRRENREVRVEFWFHGIYRVGHGFWFAEYRAADRAHREQPDNPVVTIGIAPTLSRLPSGASLLGERPLPPEFRGQGIDTRRRHERFLQDSAGNSLGLRDRIFLPDPYTTLNLR